MISKKLDKSKIDVGNVYYCKSFPFLRNQKCIYLFVEKMEQVEVKKDERAMRSIREMRNKEGKQVF